MTININRILGLIAEKRMNKNDVAKAIGLSERTFYDRLKHPETFTIDELDRLVKFLELDDPASVIFSRSEENL